MGSIQECFHVALPGNPPAVRSGETSWRQVGPVEKESPAWQATEGPYPMPRPWATAGRPSPGHRPPWNFPTFTTCYEVSHLLLEPYSLTIPYRLDVDFELMKTKRSYFIQRTGRL